MSAGAPRYERCTACDRVLLWSDRQLVCATRGCSEYSKPQQRADDGRDVERLNGGRG